MNPPRFVPLYLLAGVFLLPPLARALTEQTTTTYAWTPGLALSVGNDSGSVRISTWERDTVEVTVIKTAASRALLGKLQAHVVESPESLRLETRRAAFSPLRKAGRDAQIDFEIRVPAAHQQCVVRVDKGGATIEGLGGNVEFHGDIASLKARDLRGSLSAQTDIGRLDVGFARLAENQQVDVRTGNGSIKFLVPENADAHLDAKAELARIDCKIPVQLKHADDLVHQILVGGWGNRAGKVILRSSKGPITIERS